jgi:phage shock protein PspC (stress-responsive transcriptional regulator)
MDSPKRLLRYSADGRVAGVCAGIAHYLDTDVTLIRLTWIVLSIVPGGIFGGLLAYVAAWIIVPNSTDSITAKATRRLSRSVTDRKIAGVCGGLAGYFGLDATVVRVAWAILTFVPGCIILGVIGYLVAWFIMPSDVVPQVATALPVA